MTIGIATILQNEVLLIADGRQVPLYQSGEQVKRDDVDKIFHLAMGEQVDIALISFGITHITNLALQIIPNAHLRKTPEDICKIIDAAVAHAWEELSPRFDSNVDLARNDHVAGFVIGGRVTTTPFVGAMVRSSNQSLIFDWSPFTNAIAALPDNMALLFQATLSEEYERMNATKRVNGDDMRQVYLRTGVKTIREAEKIYPNSVGGIVRYGIVTMEPRRYLSGVCPIFDVN